MTRHRILIVYATSFGHTRTIAARMEGTLAADGFDVTVMDAAHLPRDFDSARFDGIIAAASIIGGKHQRRIARFVEHNRATLNRLPSAFVSVSGSAASPDPKLRADAVLRMESFLGGLAWQPDLETTLGGAILYTRYNWLLRWVMKRITSREGGPTDTTRDHVLTDWDRLEEFTQHFGHVAAPAAAKAADALGAGA